jgi:hypoxanthine phosphoribosyltransferase
MLKLKSALEYEKIVYTPDEVRKNWTELRDQLMKASETTLVSQGKHLSSDPSFEYFLRGIFDETGAIAIKKTDFKVDSPVLKAFYEKQWNNYNVRRLENSQYYFLRGSMYYMAYIDMDASLLLVKLLEEIGEIESVLLEVRRIKFAGDFVDFLLVLGLLDNRKNHVIELLSAFNQMQRVIGNFKIGPETYSRLLQYVQSAVDDFFTLLLTKEFEFENPTLIGQFHAEADYMLLNVVRNGQLINQYKEKIFRKYREANNPYYNGLLAKAVCDRFKLEPFADALLGIEYGGIELPFIVNTFLQLSGMDRLPIYLGKYSHYSQIQPNSEGVPVAPFQNLALLKGKRVLVLEDNALTGLTIQKVIENLRELAAREAYLGLVSCADVKRYYQMVMPDHGLINPNILLNSALVAAKSPFTRIYSSRSYKNKNGVFNKIEHKVLRSLFGNYPGMRFKV